MKAFQFDALRGIVLYAEQISETFMNYYKCLPDTLKVEDTYVMLEADRKARSVSESIIRYFGIHLIDEFKLNYHDLKFKFSILAEQWKDICTNQEQIKLPSLSDVKSSIRGALECMADSLDTLNKEIYEQLKSISSNFAAVDTIFSNYDTDESLMQAVHDKRYDDFLVSDYLKERQQRFFNAVSAHLVVNGSSCESYQVFCNNIMSCGNTLFNIYVEGGDVCSYMVEHKTEITVNDVNSYFLNRYKYEELQKRIMRFEYEEPCEARYKGMFKNKSAQELAKLFLQVFYKYIDKLKGNRYAMVMLAFKDMKIIEKDTTISKFQSFVNNEVLLPNGENLISDHKTITKVLSPLRNSSFKRLTRNDLADTELSENVFDRLSDTYWQCISIINLVFGDNLAAKGFANYLCTPHKVTSMGIIFDDDLKLKTILSLFRGDKPRI